MIFENEILKTLVIIVLIVTGTETIAQIIDDNLKIKWSETLKQTNVRDAQIIDGDSCDFTTIVNFVTTKNLKDHNNYQLTTYNCDLSAKASKPLNFKYNKKSVVPSKLVYVHRVKNNYYVLYSIFDEESKKNILLAQQLDLNTLELIGEGQIVLDDQMLKNSSYSTLSYNITSSPNEEKLLLTIEFANYGAPKVKVSLLNDKPNWEGNKVGYLEFVVLNSSLKFERKISNRVAMTTDSYVTDKIITDDGNVYFVLSSFSGSSKADKEDISNYTYHVYCIDAYDDLHKFPINLEAFVTDFKLKISKTSDILCTGYYHLSPNFANGIYFLLINNDEKKKKVEYQQKLDLNPLLESTDEKSRKKMKKYIARGLKVGYFHYKFLDVIEDASGGYFLLGEQQKEYDEEIGQRDQLFRNTLKHYKFLSINISYLNKEGKPVWGKVIEKKQDLIEMKSGLRSYTAFEIDGNLNILYNDNLNNYQSGSKVESAFYKGNYAKSVLVLERIDCSGRLTRNIIPYSNASNLVAYPETIKRSRNRSLLIYGANEDGYKSKYGFGKLILSGEVD